MKHLLLVLMAMLFMVIGLSHAIGPPYIGATDDNMATFDFVITTPFNFVITTPFNQAVVDGSQVANIVPSLNQTMMIAGNDETLLMGSLDAKLVVLNDVQYLNDSNERPVPNVSDYAILGTFNHVSDLMRSLDAKDIVIVVGLSNSQNARNNHHTVYGEEVPGVETIMLIRSINNPFNRSSLQSAGSTT